MYVPERCKQLVASGQCALAYRTSLVDSRRTRITADELTSQTLRWRFKAAAGEDWTAFDPYWRGEEPLSLRFQPDGRVVRQPRSHGVGTEPVLDNSVELTWRFCNFPDFLSTTGSQPQYPQWLRLANTHAITSVFGPDSSVVARIMSIRAEIRATVLTVLQTPAQQADCWRPAADPRSLCRTYLEQPDGDFARLLRFVAKPMTPKQAIGQIGGTLAAAEVMTVLKFEGKDGAYRRLKQLLDYRPRRLKSFDLEDAVDAFEISLASMSLVDLVSVASAVGKLLAAFERLKEVAVAATPAWWDRAAFAMQECLWSFSGTAGADDLTQMTEDVMRCVSGPDAARLQALLRGRGDVLDAIPSLRVAPGRYVRISVDGRTVPTFRVARHPGTWAWILESCWSVYTSGTLPALDDPEADPLLLDDSPLLTLTAGVQRDEVRNYNSGRKLDNEDRVWDATARGLQAGGVNMMTYLRSSFDTPATGLHRLMDRAEYNASGIPPDYCVAHVAIRPDGVPHDQAVANRSWTPMLLCMPRDWVSFVVGPGGEFVRWPPPPGNLN